MLNTNFISYAIILIFIKTQVYAVAIEGTLWYGVINWINIS